MKGFDEDCLLAIVDEKNRVVGSVAFSEYKRNPKKYRVFAIRLMVISENKDFVLSSDYFFEGGEYDTPYFTLLKFREDYADAFKRVDELLPLVEKRFVFQYYSNEGKYNANVRLYLALQNIDELKKTHKHNFVNNSIKLYQYSQILYIFQQQLLQYLLDLGQLPFLGHIH